MRVGVILFVVHPLVAYRLQKHSRVHMGIKKTDNALLLVPHILLKSSQIFSYPPPPIKTQFSEF